MTPEYNLKKTYVNALQKTTNYNIESNLMCKNLKKEEIKTYKTELVKQYFNIFQHNKQFTKREGRMLNDKRI